MARTKEEELKATAINFDPSDDMQGFEDINSSTKAVPFIRIMQQLSPQLNKNKPQYVEGAQLGDIVNILTGENYGSKIRLIVLKFEHIYIQWKPDREGFAGYHSPESAARLAVDKTFGKWKMENGDDLQETYSYIVLIEGHVQEGSMVVSMKSKELSEAKTWNRLMTTHLLDDGSMAKPYYLIWEFSTYHTENKKGDWFAPSIKFDGLVNEQILLAAREERKVLPMKSIDYAAIAAPEDELPDNM